MNRLLCLAVALPIAVCGLYSPSALADEGMWMPQQLPALEDRLEELGLELDPETLTKLTEHPMGAVISLGGCTASFVSPQGLVVTNHHCAYGSIQYNSTKENNLLKKGFLAANMADELPASPGSRVYVTEKVTEVTDQILAAIPANANGAERYDAIEAKQKALVATCEAGGGYRCDVDAYYGGLHYYLIKQLEIRDVRLVYAPSKDIGKYGGDIDNWMWPRHTGDWSFFRAYVGPDGKPADFSKDNVPYKPKHWLQVSDEGLEPGDFVMVVGYPGNTDRYRLAAEVKNAFDWRLPTVRNIFKEWLAIIERTTADNEAAAIKYASTVAGLNNAMKNYSGKLEGYAAGNTLERKMAREDALAEWIAADAARQKKYGTAVDKLEALVAESQSTRERDLRYALAKRSSLLSVAERLYRLSIEQQKPDAEREPGYQERDMPRIKAGLTRMEHRFASAVDKALWQHFILQYAVLPANQHMEDFDTFFGITDNGIAKDKLSAKLDAMYANTGLMKLENRMSWLGKSPEAFRKSDDPFIKLAVALYESNRQLEAESEALSGQFIQARPQYMAALIAWKASQDKIVYPDANGTLRVTFGTVKGYQPRDGVWYTPFTTLDGIVEKNTGEWPFDAPEAELQAIASRDFGPYYDQSLNSVPVDFLSTVDTTGGNSGSPTLNAEGELVGLLFDGTYDSIISDWDYDKVNTRSIHVDTQYMLWVMDKVDHADYLLKEMGIEPKLK